MSSLQGVIAQNVDLDVNVYHPGTGSIELCYKAENNKDVCDDFNLSQEQNPFLYLIEIEDPDSDNKFEMCYEFRDGNNQDGCKEYGLSGQPVEIVDFVLPGSSGPQALSDNKIDDHNDLMLSNDSTFSNQIQTPLTSVDDGTVAEYNIRGVGEGQSGNYQEAINYFDKALAIDPNDLDALHNKGYAFYNLGKPEQALIYFDKALAIDPNLESTLRIKGMALDELGRHEESIIYYDKALAIDPGDKATLNNKGLALANLERFDEAITEYDKALAIDPDYELAKQNKEVASAYRGN